MSTRTSEKSAQKTFTIAICGNPNSGKTTIFNHITGLNQKVGNYSGVTVEKVSGSFSLEGDDRKFELVDIPGTYSLAAFSPDEFIAVSALCGGIEGAPAPDVLICVVDATNLERSLYFLLQLKEIGRPTLVVLNMSDLARRRKMKIDINKLGKSLGMQVVPVVGHRGEGIDELKKAAVDLAGRKDGQVERSFDDTTEGVLEQLAKVVGNRIHNRAELIRILFDQGGPAEEMYDRAASRSETGLEKAQAILDHGRDSIKRLHGALHVAESKVLTEKATQIYADSVQTDGLKGRSRSEIVDRFALHPVLGPVLLLGLMTIVFQSIFSWAAPFMDLIDGTFGSFAEFVEGSMSEGPLRSLITDGIIGGVGSVLIFLPQIVILFLFISFLEDSGYMARAAFLVDRMFRWCGLSGKSFIPMLSSFACSIPGVMATRTIEDRKLRFITILVAPLMPCSARLPVYAIMIAAFVPSVAFWGIFNLQGLVLTALYLLGVAMAVIVSFVLQKTVFKTERGTFMMDMPSYKLPTLRSVLTRVLNRSKSFTMRAGTVIFAITIVIWALSYYPRSEETLAAAEQQQSEVEDRYLGIRAGLEEELAGLTAGLSESEIRSFDAMTAEVEAFDDIEALEAWHSSDAAGGLNRRIVESVYQIRRLELSHESTIADMANDQAGTLIRNSYFGRMGRFVEPAFKPLGWDWRVTMSVLASFPAREVIIATLGTIYNLGADVDEESTSLVEKMRQAKWETGSLAGTPVFTLPVALSIMVFFALCCQCGATVVTVKQETKSWSWAAALFFYMTGLAYVMAFVAYQLFKSMGL